MPKPTDVHVKDVSIYFIDIRLRMPLKFGHETVSKATGVRVKMTVADASGKESVGWGETPLSVAWVWPGTLGYDERTDAMKEFCIALAKAWEGFEVSGHPMEVGHAFVEGPLDELHAEFNASRDPDKTMPWLGALVADSAFDIALHDAYGVSCGRPVYETYSAEFMNQDLSAYLTPAEDADVSFEGLYPCDFFADPVPTRLPAWHLVGGKDPIDESELTGSEPDDEYPVLLGDWIRTDGLNCLKVKLVGNDAEWDRARLLKVADLAIELGVDWLTADFNCTVKDPAYVNEILDWLRDEHPRIHGMILYVEQPFPYDLEANRIDVHSVSARKPLFMDESAHDWHLVRLGRGLGWTGVALKTCKTQTGALLTLCWAKAHGMTLMVQDLTNPMLAQIPHLLLAAYAGTIMGVETNSMQFKPAASKPEEAVHPGVYKRREGVVDLSTLSGPGFGYRVDEMERVLPDPAYGS